MFQNWSRMVLPTAAQIRAARGLIGWSQTELSEAAGFSLMTVKRFETQNGAKVSDDAVGKMSAALEAAGVVFIPENGDGPGVRLKKTALSGSDKAV
jgi:transcriptional regulator with XRE-family HTH domain